MYQACQQLTFNFHIHFNWYQASSKYVKGLLTIKTTAYYKSKLDLLHSCMTGLLQDSHIIVI